MYLKHQLASLLEKKRLLVIVGLSFAVVLSLQYFELPYGNVFFSSIFAGKKQVSPVESFSTRNTSSSFSIAKAPSNRNSTSFDGINEKEPLGEKEASAPDGDPEDDESPSKDLIEPNSTVEVANEEGSNKTVLEKAFEDPQTKSASDNEIIPSSLVESGNVVSTPTCSPTPQPSDSLLSSGSAGIKAESPGNVVSTPTSSPTPQPSDSLLSSGGAVIKAESPGLLRADLAPSLNNSLLNYGVNRVVSLSEMNDILIANITAYRAKKPRHISQTDRELMVAKTLILSSPSVQDDPNLYAPLFRNVSMFKRSYELMEKTLKVYIYKEGGRPIFHSPALKGIYASEGWFMKQIKASQTFVTRDPRKAHLFYLPFSSRQLEETLYIPNSHSHKNLIQHLSNYLGLIRSRYPFWNRTGGSDHFLVACHDWAPTETKKIMANCIRALCNTDLKEGFQFGKDVSLAETNVRQPKNPLKTLGGHPSSSREVLAFFAGKNHGYLRPILMQQWENKDPDIKVFGKMPKARGKMSYTDYMKSSKYCLCPKGYEVNSPRVVEAIFYECVPVIISDNFVPPFFETLNWESFALFVPEKDIPNLKNILVAIPEERYLLLQKRVKLVQQHFLWHTKPVKYDIFNMILHSIWYTRVMQLDSS